MTPTIKSLGVEVELAVYMKNTPVVCSFVPFTKTQPLEFKKHLFSKDASMLELAVAPATEPGEFDTLMVEAMDKAMTLIPEGAELRAVPCVEYTDEELAKDAYASEMGCSPSQTIYDTVPTPEAYPDNKRYGGTHINLAMHNEGDVQEMVLKLDYALGLNSVVYHEDGMHEEMKDRRRVYGRAGEFRIKPFGFEYRTLPNCANLSGLILWRDINNAMKLNTDDLIPMADDIKTAINNSDRYMAEGLLGRGLLNGI